MPPQSAHTGVLQREVGCLLTAKMRLEHRIAASSGVAGRVVRRLGYKLRRSRSNFVAVELPTADDQA